MISAQSLLRVIALLIGVGALGAACPSSAQAPDPSSAPSTPPAPSTVTAVPGLDQLSWLHGCWDGKVNERDFREEWLPLRGDMMIGASQTVTQGKTQDFEYLRLETRPDGVYYVAVPSGKSDTPFRLSGKTVDGDDQIFTFDNPSGEFPQRIIYRRGTKGWLYAHVEGSIAGKERKVIYPMRRVDCQSGDVLEN